METFTINKRITKEKISWNEIDECIDAINGTENQQECEYEYNILIKYVLQRMYLAGKTETTVEEVDQKVRSLCLDKMVYHLQNEDIVEILYDKAGEEYFELTPFGKEIAKGMSEYDN